MRTTYTMPPFLEAKAIINSIYRHYSKPQHKTIWGIDGVRFSNLFPRTWKVIKHYSAVKRSVDAKILDDLFRHFLKLSGCACPEPYQWDGEPLYRGNPIEAHLSENENKAVDKMYKMLASWYKHGRPFRL